MNARQAQAHPWLHSWDQSPEALRADILGSLRTFHQFSTLKKVAMEVVAFTLRPDQIKGLRREFEKVDVCSNGEITLEELSRAIESSGLLSPADLGALVKGLDVGRQHAGTISWHEFLAATMDAALLDEEHIQLAFQRIDTGRSGFISKENFAELVGADMTTEQVQQVFAEVDLDQDGKLSCEEFASLMKGTAPPQPPVHTAAPGAGRRVSGNMNGGRAAEPMSGAGSSSSSLTSVNSGSVSSASSSFLADTPSHSPA
eukprot:evm.model.NODE_24274_length_29257_cov_20.527943.9